MSGRLGEFTECKGDGNGLMRHVQVCVGCLAVGTLGPMPIPYQAIFLRTPFSGDKPPRRIPSKGMIRIYRVYRV